MVTWIALLVRTQEKRCRRQALSIRAMTRIIGFRSADAGGKNLKFRQRSDLDVGKVEDAENYSSGLVSWEAFRPGATCANVTHRYAKLYPYHSFDMSMEAWLIDQALGALCDVDESGR